MVLAQYTADESPLSLLRLRRADAEIALRKSLATSSMLALTFCVALLLARALFFAPTEVRVLDIPVWYPPHDSETPPIPSGDYVPPATPPAAVPNADIKAVDDVTETPIIEDPKPFVPTGPNPGTTSDVGTPGPGTGPAPPPMPEPDPAPGAQFVEELPDPVARVIPIYPPIAREAGMEGKVVVRMLIGLDGRVKRAEIEKSSAMFDDAALTAARQWVFSPAKTNGHAVKAWVWVPFDFRLH